LGPTMWFTNTSPLPFCLSSCFSSFVFLDILPVLLYSFRFLFLVLLSLCSPSSIYSKSIFWSCKWRICSSKAWIRLNVSKGLSTWKWGNTTYMEISWKELETVVVCFTKLLRVEVA
jgi:hypothetical protein